MKSPTKRELERKDAAEIMRAACIKIVAQISNSYVRDVTIRRINQLSYEGVPQHDWKEAENYPKFSYCRNCGAYPQDNTKPCKQL